MVRLLIALLLALPGAAASADEAAWAALARGGQVVLVRHAATTPGAGDPPGFRLEDCATQRNLSQAGRREARRLGEAFRSRGVRVARVLSSPWCRCLESAELAFGVRPATHPALGNLVLFTHGSTTLALTGEYPAMGEAILVTPAGGGAFRVAGRIAP